MKKTMRPAIAMIELIFSLVILAIVLRSAPMLISTATNSGYVALQQEAIATAAAELGMILTNHWDEGDTNTSNTAPILVTLGDVELNVDPTTGRRAGTPSSSHRTFISALGTTLISATSSANLGNDGDIDDIDDYATGVGSGFVDLNTTTNDEGDLIDKDMSILTTVTYISDTAAYNTGTTLTFNNPFNTASAADTSNIKYINVTLTTTNTTEELAKTISLNAFSCNIGTYQLNERTF